MNTPALSIRLNNVTKQFTLAGKTITILDSVSLTFPTNALSCIIGASGSGKSTLLNILGGLDRPVAGQVLINDHDITKLSEHKLAKLRNRDIGFIFQQHQLISELTVLENILLPAIILNQANEAAHKYADYLLTRTQLKTRAHHLSGELSGGEMQRAAIARALINQPMLILADEPTGDLDDENAFEVFGLLKELAAEKRASIIMVTHDLKLAQQADIIYEIREHKLLRVRIKSQTRSYNKKR